MSTTWPSSRMPSQAGCQKIIGDRVSGTVAERPGLATIKELLRTGEAPNALAVMGISEPTLYAYVRQARFISSPGAT